jgi:flagellar basal body-associated protein FliL
MSEAAQSLITLLVLIAVLPITVAVAVFWFFVRLHIKKVDEE